MSASVLARDVAACRAWERRLHAGSAETRAHAAMPRGREWVIPLAMPIYGALACGTGVRFDAEWWVFFIPWWWLVAWGRAFPRKLPTEWEALALPSRRAWLLGRLSLRAPAIAWLGACTIAGLLLRGLRDVPDPEGLRWGVLATLLLAPALVAVVAAWQPFADRFLGGGMAALAAFLAVFGAVLGIGGAIMVTAQSEGIVILGWSFLGLGVVFAAFAAHSVALLARAVGGIGAVAWIGFVGLLAAGAIVCLVVAALMWKEGLLVPAGGTRPAVATFGLPILALAGILVPWIDLWHRVETAEVGLQPVPVATTRAKPVAPPGSRPVARGGSLLAASWALYRGRWRVAPHPVLFFLPRLLWHLRAPAGGAAAAVVCTMAAHLAGWHSALFLWMAGLLLVVGVPFHFDLPESRRLHLLGADWAPVAHHNLAWAVALSVIPATAGACAAALLPIGTTIGWTGAICMVAGFTAIRTCIWVLDSSWDALPDGRPGCLLPLAGIAAIAAGYRFAPEATHVAFGAAVLAIGVFGLYREWRDPEAAGRRVEAAASDD